MLATFWPILGQKIGFCFKIRIFLGIMAAEKGKLRNFQR
jgi:hypothetical protein